MSEVRLYTVELNDTDALTVIAALRHVAQHHERKLIKSVADDFQHHYNYGRKPVVIDKYGTIIEGTLKSSDIGPACLNWLQQHTPEVYQKIASTFLAEYDQKMDKVDRDFWDTHIGEFFLYEEVYDRMAEQAPDGYYFGAHPGDGCDIGFHLEEI